MADKIHVSTLSDDQLMDALLTLVDEVLERRRRDALTVRYDLDDGSPHLVVMARNEAVAGVEDDMRRTSWVDEGRAVHAYH